MIILSEASPDLDPDKSDGDINGATKVAQGLGLLIHFLRLASEYEPDEDPLAGVPTLPREQAGVWIGRIPTPEWYAHVHARALARGIRLVNAPEEHLRTLEFDHAYPRLAGLTPRSVVVDANSRTAAGLSSSPETRSSPAWATSPCPRSTGTCAPRSPRPEAHGTLPVP